MPDWDAHGLLDGLDDGAREARARLLDALHAEGVTLEELRQACEEDRLMLLPIDRALMGPPRYTLAELAREAGLAPEWLSAARQAMGFPRPGPDDVAFADEDLEAARRARLYRDAGLPEDELVGTMRVLSASLRRSAEVIRATFARAMLEPGIGEDELGQRFATMTEHLMPLVEADLSYLLRAHLREHTRQDAISMSEMQQGDIAPTQAATVAFVDVVGFTELGEAGDPEALGDVAERLLHATEALVAPPVRVIKTIGDAVMLASPEADPLVELAIGLVEDDQLPDLHAGVAYGPALSRFGDLYGSTVNRAARLCARARPGAVLTDTEVRDAVDGAFAWSEAGLKRLKGISGPVPAWRVRRSSGA